MITIIVSYAGTSAQRFDRAYYVDVHLPLVRDAWGPVGLESVDAFFPANHAAGYIALAICCFRDDKSFGAALAEARTAEVMTDVKNFTDITPSRYRLDAI